MSFASPDRLAWLLLAVPLILFYLLRTRPRRLPVSTLLFWQQVFDQKRQRSWWQRLRHLLSLLLQLAFLALLTTALIDPLWPDQEDRIRRLAIVLDNSASMQAEDDDGQSRFSEAVREARDVVARLRDGDEVALITAGGPVRVAVGTTDFPPAVRDALRTIRLTDGPTQIEEAVTLARRLIADRQRREIIVISDGCFDSADRLASEEDIRLVTVGQPADNVAVTALQTRRSLVDPIGYALFVEVQNLSDDATDCRLSIELGGELVDVLPLELEPNAVWRKAITHASPRGGILTASLDAHDSLSVDNVARAVLPARPEIPVTLVTDRPSVYLQKVLEAIPLVQLKIVGEAPTAAPAGGIVVLHRSVPQALPRGPLLVIDPQADSDRWQLGGVLESAIVAEQAKDSPLLPHVQLVNVAMPASHGLDVPDAAEPLLTSVEGAVLMASMMHASGRTVILSTDIDGGDLPLRIAFPVMMTNAMNWLLNRSGELEPTIRTGAVAEVAYDDELNPRRSATEVSAETELASDVDADADGASADASPVLWRDSEGRLHPASITGDRASLGPVDQVGIVEIGPRAAFGTEESQAGSVPGKAEQQVRQIAINLANAAESDLRPDADLPREEASALTLPGQRSIWFYLCIAALGLILGEWVLYQRRVVG